jgi:hypothetical protein
LLLVAPVRPAGRPFGLPGFIENQVLTNLDLHVRQPARFAVLRDREIGFVAHDIRLVLGHRQVRLAAQHIQHKPGEAPIPVVEHRRVHRAAHALEDVGHAVLSHEDRRPAGAPSLIEQLPQAIVVGLEDLRAPCGDLLVTEADIAWNLDGFRHPRYGRGDTRVAIAIDDQAGVVARHERGIERRGDPPRDLERTDVPCAVALELGRRQAESAEASRDAAARMVHRDQETRSAFRPDLEDR